MCKSRALEPGHGATNKDLPHARTLGKASSRTVIGRKQQGEGSGTGAEVVRGGLVKCGKATICYKLVDRNKGTHSGWQDVSPNSTGSE